MSEKIVQLNEEVIKGQLKELVRSSVEETLNELLEQEAEKLMHPQMTRKPPFSSLFRTKRNGPTTDTLYQLSVQLWCG